MVIYDIYEGNTYDGALEKVYGFDMDGLDILWRDYITMSAQLNKERVLVASATGG